MNSSSTITVRYPAPVSPEDLRLATLLFVVPGFGLLAFGGLLMPGSVAGLVAGSILAALGLGLFVCAAIGRRGMRREMLSVEIGPDGFGFPVRDARMMLRWTDLSQVVLVEKRRRTEVCLAPAEHAERRLAGRFSLRTAHGFVLSTAFAPEEAHRLANAVERAAPGLVRWPSFEVRRGGLGIERTVAMVVRRGARPVPLGAGVSVTVRANQASGRRKAAMWGTAVALAAVLIGQAWLPILGPGLGFVALCLIALVCTRHRGALGVFVVDGRSVSWHPDGGKPVVVRRKEISRLVAEGGVLRVLPRRGAAYPLAEDVSPAAARAVVRRIGAPPASITRGAT
ncbi:hypothetical protein [Amycolatopsis jiangsuensis]|uniref:Uncharacterized protein n=1 Tax=Amycolatopsis jiangsuensis TaxID=1181879 RepID=A0A840J1K9_9PSEU|nr:hypothetical protein [Amycolatopsis jiangsuensis]MBB4687278.1 hypothetical protein [Amycolatopsis jiangsuensis]